MTMNRSHTCRERGKQGKNSGSPTVELIENKGMKQKDVKKALSIVRTYREDIINAWNVFFNK